MPPLSYSCQYHNFQDEVPQRQKGIVKSIEANNVPNYLEDTHFDLVKLVFRVLMFPLRRQRRWKNKSKQKTPQQDFFKI